MFVTHRDFLLAFAVATIAACTRTSYVVLEVQGPGVGPVDALRVTIDEAIEPLTFNGERAPIQLPTTLALRFGDWSATGVSLMVEGIVADGVIASGTAFGTVEPGRTTRMVVTLLPLAPACGDDRVDPGETCDGLDLGGTTCATMGFSGGALGCGDDCQGFDASGCIAPPTVPVLRKPMNNEYTGSVHVPGSLRPTFVWEPSAVGVGLAVTYEVQYGIEEDFSGTVNTATTAMTAHRPDLDVDISVVPPVGARYYWRVRACVGSACSAWSTPWRVNIGRSDDDFNGDGYSDLLVGAVNDSVGGTDSAYVFFGGEGSPAEPFDSTADITLIGQDPGDRFGRSVAWAGDVNADGFGDVIVGAHVNDDAGVDAGSAYIYLGGPSGAFDAFPDATLRGEQAGDGFGYPVASAGDVNGDGYVDVVVGAVYAWSTGRAYVFFGAPGATLDDAVDVVLTGAAAGDQFGASVASAGDVNGDGYADVFVGANLSDSSAGSDAGAAYVYFGGDDGALDSVADLTVTGANDGDWFGFALASAGDVNGDGFADVVVGAWLNEDAGPVAGSAYLYLGGPGEAFDAIPDGTLSGVSYDTFGIAVGGAGDVNGDGYSDVVVGAPSYNQGFLGGERTDVFFGGPGTAFNSLADRTLQGDAPGDEFGFSVAIAGDLNGDGSADVLVGAFGNDAGGTEAGAVYVYFGGSGAALDAAPDAVIAGSSVGGNFGVSVGP